VIIIFKKSKSKISAGYNLKPDAELWF